MTATTATTPTAPRSHPVQAFACSMCSRPHVEKSEADDCCACSGCGAKFPRRGYGSECGSCSYGGILREARAAVRRADEQLASAKRRLAELITQKRPARGTEPV